MKIKSKSRSIWDEIFEERRKISNMTSEEHIERINEAKNKYVEVVEGTVIEKFGNKYYAIDRKTDRDILVAYHDVLNRIYISKLLGPEWFKSLSSHYNYLKNNYDRPDKDDVKLVTYKEIWEKKEE